MRAVVEPMLGKAADALPGPAAFSRLAAELKYDGLPGPAVGGVLSRHAGNEGKLCRSSARRAQWLPE